MSVLPDTASYDGIPRIGIRMKASGQLNGSPDELRAAGAAALADSAQALQRLLLT